MKSKPTKKADAAKAATVAATEIARRLFTPGGKGDPCEYLRLANQPNGRGPFVEIGCGWSMQPVIDMMTPIIRKAMKGEAKP